VKLLLDTCVWGKARQQLTSAGHDVIWAGDWLVDPGDEEILRIASQEGRILVTLDKDFGELAIVRGAAHSGIVRLVNLRAAQQATVCQRVLELHGDELQAGAIITAEAGRLRIRAASGQDPTPEN
jgi:predicted nuclease of predicted toxin-antitoxin system